MLNTPTLGMMMKKFGEKDIVRLIKSTTTALSDKEATDAGTALVRRIGAGVHLPPAIFGPLQQIVTDVGEAHKHGIKLGHPDAAELRALVNVHENKSVLPRVVTEMGGTQAAATRKLRAMYVASRVAPISQFRESAASRNAKMDDMRRLAGEFDRRLAAAQTVAQANAAEAARAFRLGLFGGRKRTRKGRKGKKRTRTVRKRTTSKRGKGRSVTRRRN